MAQGQRDVHVPVLRDAVLKGLELQPGGVYVDATLGLGGHAEAILRFMPPVGRLIGFEWDADAAAMAAERLAVFGGRFDIVPASYVDLIPELDRLGIKEVDGLIADLGVSSLQLDRADRGFGFKNDSALDMRMDRSRPVTAVALVARLSEEELADIFYYYGEEQQARRIARFLVQARAEEPVVTTGRLAAIVAAAVPRRYHPPKVHVATKVFQALRIAVNQELDNVTRLLTEASTVLLSGARVCMITFHSLEDRIVKQVFARNPAYAAVSRRPIKPAPEEIERNPRARSAKLRIAART
ncbi:MAG: 16S rRNA (cytosine(1402)-N(4))-methyltransferase RsmH [Desulfobulbus sp.]|nr:16S rRNA (cytosine(1402)-N(4))-methyltransferase RsmH [Desulfobulbus sp.]